MAQVTRDYCTKRRALLPASGSARRPGSTPRGLAEGRRDDHRAGRRPHRHLSQLSSPAFQPEHQLPWRDCRVAPSNGRGKRSEEHTSELQSLMRISYAVFCLKKKKKQINVHVKIQNQDTYT